MTSSHRSRRGGFTLLELLVVIVIILLLCVVALPVILPALESRQTREAERLLATALAGCRDRAIATGRPSGLRLLPDPGLGVSRLADGSIDPSAVLAFNRWVPVEPAPDYSEGRVTARPGVVYAPAVHDPSGQGRTIMLPSGQVAPIPTLILEEAPLDPLGLPNPPTSWYWNVRVGDRVQINDAGAEYTVVGPCWQANPEMFCNVGTSGSSSPLGYEYLILADGRDDGPMVAYAGAGGPDGWPDSGWDGVDNDGDGLADNPAEWERERWIGLPDAGVAGVPYAIRRRPAPVAGSRDIALPTRVVIDATTWGTTRERSRLPVDRLAGTVEVLINPDGTAIIQTSYGVPSSLGMDAAFLHFWLADRGDVAVPSKASPALPAPAAQWALVTVATRSGRVGSTENPDPATAFARAQQGGP